MRSLLALVFLAVAVGAVIACGADRRSSVTPTPSASSSVAASPSDISSTPPDGSSNPSGASSIPSIPPTPEDMTSPESPLYSSDVELDEPYPASVNGPRVRSAVASGSSFGGAESRLRMHRDGGPRNVPKIRQGRIAVVGSMPPEVIQRITRQNFGRFRLCYEAALDKNELLEGIVEVKFRIDAQGSVTNVRGGDSAMADPNMIACVVRAFEKLSFPTPDVGVVDVTYPLEFTMP